MTKYTFSEFLNPEKSDKIPHLFSTTEEVNDLIPQIITIPEVKEKLLKAGDFREFCYVLFDEIDKRLEIDSLKDICYISFRVGMAVQDTYRAFQLQREKMEVLKVLQN